MVLRGMERRNTEGGWEVARMAIKDNAECNH